MTEIPAGAPCWIDLMTADPARAKEFYTALFGWTYETGDVEKYGGYTTALKDGKSVAGLMQSNPDDAGHPDVWSTYLRVDDIDATVAAATKAGGVTYLAPMDVPEQGRMAMLGDPAGAAVGLWEFGGHTGFQAHSVDGAANWHELWTKDYPAALKFYQDVFGWKTAVMSDTPEFRYSTVGEGRDSVAGVMDASRELPEQAPSSWQVYFQVDDADAAVATALSLGATVVQPAQDTPFGRLAGLTDPTGALFKVIQPPAR
ncbi:VOC family protein [Arthrobacter sp. STN4]|uniref:VOC family protein n=1 Tax=Arthrobacter sp. STN4 TaxID=2923276 RepID=UPI002119F2BC|nr:VOC family protein [Arthrobacter sp. STN4]MCQ9164963.1 VOC family protein [Arthrobacter sp. STN4]